MFDARKARNVPGARPPLLVDCVVTAHTMPLLTSEPFAETVGPPVIPGFTVLTAAGVVTKRLFTKLKALRTSRRSQTYSTPSFSRLQNAVPNVCAQSFWPHPLLA